jgi:hypothetical protein
MSKKVIKQEKYFYDKPISISSIGGLSRGFYTKTTLEDQTVIWHMDESLQEIWDKRDIKILEGM